MKFTIENNSGENLLTISRSIGYQYFGGNEEKHEYSFVKTLGGGSGYPRFHIYLILKGKIMNFNLHLDQNKTVYEGSTAHQGDYDGEIVEKEAERIKEILMRNEN